MYEISGDSGDVGRYEEILVAEGDVVRCEEIKGTLLRAVGEATGQLLHLGDIGR